MALHTHSCALRLTTHTIVSQIPSHMFDGTVAFTVFLMV